MSSEQYPKTFDDGYGRHALVHARRRGRGPSIHVNNLVWRDGLGVNSLMSRSDYRPKHALTLAGRLLRKFPRPRPAEPAARRPLVWTGEIY